MDQGSSRSPETSRVTQKITADSGDPPAEKSQPCWRILIAKRRGYNHPWKFPKALSRSFDSVFLFRLSVTLQKNRARYTPTFTIPQSAPLRPDSPIGVLPHLPRRDVILSRATFPDPNRSRHPFSPSRYCDEPFCHQYSKILYGPN